MSSGAEDNVILSNLLADVHFLADRIGPRGTGTQGESAAAAYVSGRLSELGLSVERQDFRAVASQNAFPMGIKSVALLAVALYSFDSRQPTQGMVAASNH